MEIYRQAVSFFWLEKARRNVFYVYLKMMLTFSFLLLLLAL